jgi:HSP20 family protein
VDVEKLHNEVLRAFNDSCVIATRQQYRGRGFRPAADAYFEEDTREIVVRFDLAGIAMSDIELLVDRRELVVRGERAFPTREGRVYQQVEMDYGPFERRVRLMVDVDPEVTTATYEAGVLEVRLTLTERDQGARKIDIRTGGGDE